MKLKDGKIKILGAGLSGLSAAINLAKVGKDVIVYEKRDDVGRQIKPSFQCVLIGMENFKNYLKGLNLNPEFMSIKLSKVYLLTRKRSFDVIKKYPSLFVSRGGESSLEYGLYREAKELGVVFEFNTNKDENDVDIVASGHKNVDGVAFGAVFENANFSPDHYLMMFDDRFTPKGMYFYIIPHPDGSIEAMNVVSKKYIPFVKKLFFKVIKKREFLQDIFKNSRIINYIGGAGNIKLPKTAIINGRLYVGEAAGFQDAFRGFGMNFALESGKLAADTIIYNKNYDLLWRRQFMYTFKTSFAERFVASILGDRIFELVFRKIKKGGKTNFSEFEPKGMSVELLKEVFINLELLKNKLTGYW